MSRRPPSFPPPTDAAARYDAVVRRGHVLRRRQRLARGAVASGAALALVLVVVLAAGAMGGSDGGGTRRQDVVTGPVVTDTTPTTIDPDKLLVTATAVGDGAVEVHVTDPTMPIADGTQMCVNVRVDPDRSKDPIPKLDGRACWTLGPDAATTASELVPLDGAYVGCAATATKSDTVPPTEGVATHEHDFRFTLPAGVAPGTYVVTATGVSGVGDGCDPVGQPGEIEKSDNATTKLTVG